MSRMTCVVAVALIAWLAAPMAHADTTVVAKSGPWSAFEGTSTEGTGVCGISISPEGQYFGLKSFANRDTFTIQISVKEWKVTNDVKYPLTMRFDARSPWNAKGVGFHFKDGDPGLEYDVLKRQLDLFMQELAGSKKLVIQIGRKGLASMRLNVADVGGVVDRFKICLKK